MALMADVESIKHLEALMSKTWKKEMKEDIFAIEKNDIWELIELPSNKNVIKVKQVFKLKHNSDGSIAKTQGHASFQRFSIKTKYKYQLGL